MCILPLAQSQSASRSQTRTQRPSSSMSGSSSQSESPSMSSSASSSLTSTTSLSPSASPISRSQTVSRTASVNASVTRTTSRSQTASVTPSNSPAPEPVYDSKTGITALVLIAVSVLVSAACATTLFMCTSPKPVSVSLALDAEGEVRDSENTDSETNMLARAARRASTSVPQPAVVNDDTRSAPGAGNTRRNSTARRTSIVNVSSQDFGPSRSAAAGGAVPQVNVGSTQGQAGKAGRQVEQSSARPIDEDDIDSLLRSVT